MVLGFWYISWYILVDLGAQVSSSPQNFASSSFKDTFGNIVIGTSGYVSLLRISNVLTKG